MNKKFKTLAAAAAASLSLNASADIFLDIPGVKGESLVKGYEDHIEALAWSWSLSNNGTFHVGGGGGAGKATFGDIAITKYLDKASTKLYETIASGGHYEKATMRVTTNLSQGGSGVITEMVMDDVLITSASTGGNDEGERPTETITLNFRRFTLKQNSIDPVKGTIVEDPEPFKWNIAERKEF